MLVEQADVVDADDAMVAILLKCLSERLLDVALACWKLSAMTAGNSVGRWSATGVAQADVIGNWHGHADVLIATSTNRLSRWKMAAARSLASRAA